MYICWKIKYFPSLLRVESKDRFQVSFTLFSFFSWKHGFKVNKSKKCERRTNTKMIFRSRDRIPTNPVFCFFDKVVGMKQTLPEAKRNCCILRRPTLHNKNKWNKASGHVQRYLCSFSTMEIAGFIFK